MHKNTSGLVMECMIFAAIGVGCGAFGVGLVWWQALLVCLGTFVAVNLLFAIFWFVVALTAGNHRTAFDPVVTEDRLRDYNIAFLSKPSNMKLPGIARLAWGACFLAIDRENDREALKAILKAADLLKRGVCSIGLYPEGTRTKTGKLLPFHAGSFKIAQRGNAPIVVAAIQGSEKVGKNFPFRRTVVNLDILEVIPAEKVKAMSTQELSAYCRNRIAEHLGEEVGE